MNNKKRGMLVLYTGSSGVGKGTIMQELLKRDKTSDFRFQTQLVPPETEKLTEFTIISLQRSSLKALLKKTVILSMHSTAEITTVLQNSRLRIYLIRAMTFFLK